MKSCAVTVDQIGFREGVDNRATLCRGQIFIGWLWDYRNEWARLPLDTDSLDAGDIHKKAPSLRGVVCDVEIKIHQVNNEWWHRETSSKPLRCRQTISTVRPVLLRAPGEHKERFTWNFQTSNT